jgi:hypothetical protein
MLLPTRARLARRTLSVALGSTLALGGVPALGLAPFAPAPVAAAQQDAPRREPREFHDGKSVVRATIRSARDLRTVLAIASDVLTHRLDYGPVDFIVDAKGLAALKTSGVAHEVVVPDLGPVLRAAWARVGDRAALWLMFTVNRDILIRSMALQLCYVTFVFLGARFGDVTLAANQVLMQFLEITAYALDGFAFAAETLVGQAVGARALLLVRQAAVLTSAWGLAGSLVLGLAFWFGGPAVIDLMARDAEVQQAARLYLPWVAAGPVIGIAAWMFDGIFIGATLTREMRNAMILSVAVYALAVWVLLPAFGNHGLWAALMVLNVTRGVTMAAFYGRVEAKAA